MLYFFFLFQISVNGRNKAINKCPYTSCSTTCSLFIYLFTYLYGVRTANNGALSGLVRWKCTLYNFQSNSVLFVSPLPYLLFRDNRPTGRAVVTERRRSLHGSSSISHTLTLRDQSKTMNYLNCNQTRHTEHG